ncbi:MAG: hypothetical protein Ct9H300mP23_11490 [Nitrospinota bacterium]|nr:MAG: hypothetical protein Ct9H300mP23_11490 [Nitrospinota bacterium]
MRLILKGPPEQGVLPEILPQIKNFQAGKVFDSIKATAPLSVILFAPKNKDSRLGKFLEFAKANAPPSPISLLKKFKVFNFEKFLDLGGWELQDL